MTLETARFLCPGCGGDGYNETTSYSITGIASAIQRYTCTTCRGKGRIRAYECPECGKQLYKRTNKAELHLGQYDQIKIWLECDCGYKHPLCKKCDTPMEQSDSFQGTTIRGGDVVEVGNESWICPKCGYEE